MVAATIRTAAPGKLVLLGEYAVIEGAPAWVAAVNRFAEVEAAQAEGEPRLIAITGGRQEVTLQRQGDRWTASKEWALAAAAYTAAFPEGGVDITVDTNQFFLPLPEGGRGKAGYGSSAAVVAAILAASDRYSDPAACFLAAREVHFAAQGGVGSGIDIAAAVFGGTLAYRVSPQPTAEPLPLPSGLQVLAVWTGASASTPQLVGRVLEWKASSPSQFESLYLRLRDTAEAGIAAAKAGDLAALLDAVEDYGRRMSQLGRAAGAPIITPVMESLFGRLAGRAACKPSGAGGGDIILAFTTADDAPAVRAEIEAFGLPLVDLAWNAPGAAKKP
jgi:mevalonate kinase